MGGNTGLRPAGDRPLGRCEWTDLDILDTPALIADEVVVVSPQDICQLIACEAFLKLKATRDAQGAKHLNGPIDGHPVNGTVAQACMNFFDAQRLEATQ